MTFATFDVNGLRRCWTMKLARATTDALGYVGNGSEAVTGHVEGTAGRITTTGTVVDTNPAAQTVLNNHFGETDADGSLLLLVNRLDGTRGAYLAANIAVGTAVALIESQRRLHEAVEGGGGA